MKQVNNFIFGGIGVAFVIISAASFWGCKQEADELADARANGVQHLDSFLGIRIGSVFPGSNKIISCTNEWDDNGRLFVTDQNLINTPDLTNCTNAIDYVTKYFHAPQFTNWVRLTADGRVCEINSFVNFFNIPPWGGIARFEPWPLVCIEKRGRNAELEKAEAICARELETLYAKLEQKYNKPFEHLNSTKSEIRFANDRKITVINLKSAIIIRAIDERSAAESKGLVKYEMLETHLNDSDPRSINERDTMTSKKTK